MTESTKPVHVLIIEDDPLIQRVLQLQLGARGYRISIASDGAEGFEAAQTLLPDILVLDLMMPKMNGFQVLKRIKSISKLADVPVIILTASLDDSHRRKGLSHFADAYLNKPYSEEELHRTIQSLLQPSV